MSFTKTAPTPRPVTLLWIESSRGVVWPDCVTTIGDTGHGHTITQRRHVAFIIIM